MEVLLVSRSFPVHRAGGMEWHGQDVMEGLIEAGHRVHVLTTGIPTRPALKDLEPNGELTSLGARTDGSYDTQFFRHAVGEARRMAHAYRVDIIHAQGFAGIPFVLRGRNLPPVVTTIHGTLWSETPLDRRQRRHRPAFQRFLDSWRFRHRVAFWPVWKSFLHRRPPLIVDSRFTASELRREEPGLRPRVVPLGVNLERFAEIERPAIDLAKRQLVPRQPGAAHPLLLLAVGRLETIKGMDTLLHALAGLRNSAPWMLAIAGDGPEGASLVRLSQSLGLRNHVVFPGRLGDAALRRWYAAADLFLNPDRGQPAFGLTLAEALLSGCPVLASNVGAHPEVLKGPEDGWLAPGGDIKPWQGAIRAALARLPEAPEARQARRERARRRFDRRVMISRLERVYGEVLD